MDMISTQTILDFALEYAQNGWPVFPLKGKIPLTSNGFKDATCDQDQIIAWWKKFPDANIGGVTGQVSGKTVLDIDFKHGGYIVLEGLEDKHGNLPATLTSQTGGGGRHKVFNYDPHIKTGVNVYGSGLDVRNDGGYIVLPPSVHPETGNTYAWEVDTEEIADAPAWMVFPDKIQEAQPVPDILPDGSRNDILTSLAGSMRRRNMSLPAIEAALLMENELKCTPPLSKKEVLGIAKGILRYEPEEIGAQDMYTDIFNSLVFASMHKDSLRWCKELGGWLIYNEKFWQMDRNDTVLKYGLETHKKLKDLIPSIKDKAFYKHVKSLGSEYKLKAMANLSKVSLASENDYFDQNPYLFNCQNGTINLQTGEFSPFKAEDYLTKMANVDYDPQAKCPLWEQFLDQIFLGRRDIIFFMQQVIGYCLTGSTEEQCFFILYGSGRNGKSTFLETMEEMFGNYARHCPSSTLMCKQAGHIPNDVARLKGARFVNAVESGQTSTFDEPLIKQLTGGDRITARYLHKEFFEFAATFKILIATNHKPNIKGTDEGIWRRVKLIPFDWQVPKDRIDPQLTKKFKAELPGILNWAIQGYRDWRKAGLTIPQGIEAATNEYRDEEDLIGQFINERCLRGQDKSVGATLFRNDLNDYLGTGYGAKTVKKHLTDRGIQYKRISAGPNKGNWGFMGIGLVNKALLLSENGNNDNY